MHTMDTVQLQTTTGRTKALNESNVVRKDLSQVVTETLLARER